MLGVWFQDGAPQRKVFAVCRIGPPLLCFRRRECVLFEDGFSFFSNLARLTLRFVSRPISCKVKWRRH